MRSPHGSGSRGRKDPRPDQACRAGLHVGETYHPCRLWPGADDHRLRRVDKGDLGLPLLIHESSTGYEWTSAGEIVTRPAEAIDA